MEVFPSSLLIRRKRKGLQLMSPVSIPSSPTSRISIFQFGWRRKEIVNKSFKLGRDCCCCSCEWPLWKMKPLVADKLVVSLLGVEREEDATTLFSSALGKLDGEGR